MSNPQSCTSLASLSDAISHPLTSAKDSVSAVKPCRISIAVQNTIAVTMSVIFYSLEWFISTIRKNNSSA